MNDRGHDFAMTTYGFLSALENLIDTSRERDSRYLLSDLPELKQASNELKALIERLEHEATPRGNHSSTDSASVTIS